MRYCWKRNWREISCQSSHRLASGFSRIWPISLLVLLFVICACAKTDTFKGTVIDPPRPAPDFSLFDQSGSLTTLSEHKGNLTLLTFLYTSCTDICPIVVTHLKDALELLGVDGTGVNVLIVSVDPRSDTAEMARQYLDRMNVEDWTYFVGTKEELSGVWTDYFVAQISEEESTGTIASNTRGSLDTLAEEVVLSAVTHAAPVYVIDRGGVMRLLFTSPINPQDIAHDLKLLLH